MTEADMTSTVHYWLNHVRREEEVPTLAEAVEYATGGDEAGVHVSVYISGPGGTRYAPDGSPLAEEGIQ